MVNNSGNSSGATTGPPPAGPWFDPNTNGILPHCYSFLYGLWLRTGGQIAPSNSAGVGVSALAEDFSSIQTEVDSAQSIALLALMDAEAGAVASAQPIDDVVSAALVLSDDSIYLNGMLSKIRQQVYWAKYL